MLEIDHLMPKARGGTDEEANLWLACRMCNSFKRTQITARDPLYGRRVRLFNLWGSDSPTLASSFPVQTRKCLDQG